jgi:hypothetical protein
MLVNADVDTIMAHVGVEDHDDCDTFRRRIQRLLHSVMSVLETATGTSREQLGGDYYMHRDFDPHAIVANEVGAIQDRSAAAGRASSMGWAMPP